MTSSITPSELNDTSGADSTITIYSDAGVQGTKAAAACIVSDDSGKKKKFVALINHMTTIEAEAVAALMGIFIARTAFTNGEQIKVGLHTDCMTLLNKRDSSMSPSAEQDESFRKELREKTHHIFSETTITQHYVKAHSGQRENEQCDKACQWVCNSGEKLIEKCGEGPIGKLALLNPNKAWMLIDLRGKIDSFDQFYGVIKNKLGHHLNESHE